MSATQLSPHDAAVAMEANAQDNLGKLVKAPVSGEILVATAEVQTLLAISFRLADLAEAIRTAPRAGVL